MFASIQQFFGHRPPMSASGVVASAANRCAGLDVFSGSDPGELAITKYPPFDRGIPVIDVSKILLSQRDLLDRIFRIAGVAREDFERLYMLSIRRLARHVHLLPATSTTYFRGTGGLFRMSLEIALNSLQAANAAVFPSSGGVERRFYMQPKWTLATFLAGLCCQNYRTISSMAVMTRKNQQWPPLRGMLYDWCINVRVDRYFVRWMEDAPVQAAQASSAYLISQVVPADVLDYLASDNNQVMPAMAAAIAGIETNMFENPIGRLVAPVTTHVIQDDLSRSATNYGHLVIGAHLEMHIVSAMRRLIREEKWSVNSTASNGPLWVGQEGVFLHWASAAKNIADLLARDSFAGIPGDPDTLADLLVSAKLLQNVKQGGRYWTIIVPMTGEVLDGCVKLREGNVIFPQGFDFEPYKKIMFTRYGKMQKTDADTQGQGSFEIQDSCDIAAGIPTDPMLARQESSPASPPHSPRVHAQGEAAGESTGKRASYAPDHEAAPVGSALLASLKTDNAWLMGEVILAFKKAGQKEMVTRLPYGIGISYEALNAHGKPTADLLEEIGLKGWLWQDKTRASRRIHPIEVGGKTVRMMVLRPMIAEALGFNSKE